MKRSNNQIMTTTTNYMDILPEEIVERIFQFKTVFELYREREQLWICYDILLAEQIVICKRRCEISKTIFELARKFSFAFKLDNNIIHLRRDLHVELDSLNDEDETIEKKETMLDASAVQISNQLDAIMTKLTA